MCPREWFSRGLVARYWKDPHKFMPERFLGDWPRDAFMPFSQGNLSSSQCFVITTQDYFAGARACLGRRCEPLRYNRDHSSRTIFRFAEIEAIAIMTMLVSKYK